MVMVEGAIGAPALLGKDSVGMTIKDDDPRVALVHAGYGMFWNEETQDFSAETPRFYTRKELVRSAKLYAMSSQDLLDGTIRSVREGESYLHHLSEHHVRSKLRMTKPRFERVLNDFRYFKAASVPFDFIMTIPDEYFGDPEAIKNFVSEDIEPLIGRCHPGKLRENPGRIPACVHCISLNVLGIADGRDATKLIFGDYAVISLSELFPVVRTQSVHMQQRPVMHYF